MKMLMKTLGDRFGGWRAIGALSAKIALGVALIVLPILAVWPFGGPYTPRVEVDDEAGVLQVDAVRGALEQVTFRRDVDLVALTLDVPYESNFDSAVHDYATQKHPEWFGSDRRTVVLAISPSGRWVGCYFYGRLSGLSSNWKALSAIQEAGKDNLRAGDWTGGFEAAARESASLIGRPVTTFQPYVWVGLIVLAGIAWLSVLTWIALSGMRAFERACRHRDRVAREHGGVRLNARTMPQNEHHCAQVLRRFERLDGTRAELPGISPTSVRRAALNGGRVRCARRRGIWRSERPISTRPAAPLPTHRRCSRGARAGRPPGAMSRGCCARIWRTSMRCALERRARVYPWMKAV